MKDGLMVKKQICSKEEIARVLSEIGWLTISEIDQHPDLPAVMTILKLFKTTKINDVWKKLNIDVSQQKK